MTDRKSLNASKASAIQANVVPKGSELNGTSLFAPRRLEPGTLILQEESFSQFELNDGVSLDEKSRSIRSRSNQEIEALLEVARMVSDSFSQMSTARFTRDLRNPTLNTAQAFIYALHNSVFPLKGIGDNEKVCLFNTAMKLNHSCRPNAEALWDEEG
jgi:hypothetical protein